MAADPHALPRSPPWKALMATDPPPGPPLWAVGLLTALLLCGLLTAPAAGAREGDFVHLWLGGHALWSVGPAGLYDPELHRSLLSEVYAGAIPAELWAGRNDRLGAFFYPPPMGLFYALVGGLELRLAGTIHAALAVLGGAAAGALIGRFTRLGAVFGMLVVLSTPALFHNHVLGQNGGWVLLVLAGAALAMHRGRDLAGGMLLGLLVAKPSWLLAVGLVPLVLGRWRAAAAMVASALVVCGGSAVVLGWEPWSRWLALAPELAALSRAGDYPLHLQYSLWGLGRRVLGLGVAGDLLGGALSVAVLGATGVRVMRTPGAVAAKLALMLCAGSLVNPHLHPYDVTGGIFAVAMLLARPSTRRLGLLVLVVHHGGQALEGLQGSGWMVAPATVGLGAAWAALWVRIGDAGATEEPG